MKLVKIFSFCLMLIIVACSSDYTKQPLPQPITSERELIIAIDSDDTRVQLAEGKTVWSAGDRVAVIYASGNVEEWRYKGETGEREGIFTPATNYTYDNTSTTAIVYPYNANYSLSANSTIKATIPATQHYLKDSYGLDGNILVGAVGTTTKLRNACSWLRLHITGKGEVVRSIKLTGNNNEQMAGEIVVNINDATSMLTTTAANASKEVILTHDTGVTLSSTATDFYIAIPPQNLSNGFTVEVTCNDGSKMTKSTSKSIALERNTITPMAAFTFEADADNDSYPANNRIWYATADNTMLNIGDGYFDGTITEHTFGVCYGGVCYDYYYAQFNKDITKVNGSAFLYDSKIKTIYLPHSIESIGSCAFLCCTSLSTIHLGRNLKNIETGAFGSCTSLAEIYCHATTPPTLGDYVFRINGTTSYPYVQAIIYVPASAVETYKNAEGWNKFADYIRGYDFVAGEEITPEGGDTTRFNHRILLVDHTGVNCGYCPIMTDRLYALANYSNPNYDYTKRYNEVQCHGGAFAGTSDPAYSYAATIVDDFYNPSGYPALMPNFNKTAIYRGAYDWEFVEVEMTKVFNTYHKPMGADVGISVTTKTKSNNLTINIEVEAAVTNQYKVTAWVLENNIYSANQNGATTERHKTYHHALRDIAGSYSKTDISGDSLGTINKGERASKRYVMTLNSSWKSNDLEVLVIVSALNSNGSYDVANTALCPINGSRDYEYIE